MSKRFSIRRYLLRNLVLWSLVMTTLPHVLMYFTTLDEVDELFDASLVQTAKVLNGLISRKNLAQNKEHLVDSLLAKDSDLLVGGQHHPYEKKLYFQIWDKGELLVKSNKAPELGIGYLEEGFHELEAEGHKWSSFTLYSEHDDWWLVVGERRDIRSELALDIALSHLLPITLFIPLLIVIISLVVRRGFKPLNKIRRDIANRDYKQLSLIDNSETPTEIEGIVDSLNQLLKRLQVAYDKESHFVSDVAHELRTPLSGLLIHTENLIQDIEDNQAGNDLLQMKHSILRLTHLVNQLLDTSRSSRDVSQLELVQVNLRDTTLNVIRQYERNIEAKELNIQTNLDPLIITGTEPLVSSLVSNILSNAIRYTPEKGEISIGCHRCKDGSIEYVVDDTGPGIPNHLHEKIKQHFYRVNPSSSEGSGLGLAIVESIADRLSIEWEISQRPQGGLRHRFVFANSED